MSTATTPRRRRLGVFGVVAAAAIGVASLTPTASAAPVDITAPVSGTLNIDGTATEIPTGTSFTGTWDDELFTFEGDLDFATIISQQTVTTALLPGVPIDADVSIEINQVSPITGSWDPATGDAQASAVVEVQITRVFAKLGDGIDLTVSAACRFGPVNLDLTGTATQDADDNTVLSLGPSQFTIPPAPAGSCTTSGAVELDITSQVNESLAGQNNQATVVMSLAAGQEIPDTTTTTTVPVESTTTTAPATTPPATGPAQAPGATPVSGSANYTG